MKRLERIESGNGARFRQMRTGAMDWVDCRRTYLDATLEQIILQDMTLRKKPNP